MAGRFCRITQSVVKGLFSLTARAGGRDGGCYADRRRHGEVLTSRRRSRSSHVSLLCLSSATLVLSGGVGLASKRNHGSSTKWHECKHSHHCFNVPIPLSSQMRTSILKKNTMSLMVNKRRGFSPLSARGAWRGAMARRIDRIY